MKKEKRPTGARIHRISSGHYLVYDAGGNHVGAVTGSRGRWWAMNLGGTRLTRHATREAAATAVRDAVAQQKKE